MNLSSKVKQVVSFVVLRFCLFSLSVLILAACLLNTFMSLVYKIQMEEETLIGCLEGKVVEGNDWKMEG